MKVAFLLDFEDLFLDSRLINIQGLPVVDVDYLLCHGDGPFEELEWCDMADFLLGLLDLRVFAVLVFEAAVMEFVDANVGCNASGQKLGRRKKQKAFDIV